MEKMSDKKLVDTIRKMADLIENLYGGITHDHVEQLRAAADRITELAQANHDIRHMWYKGKEMCVICAHRCTNTEVDYCSDCNKECLCVACEGENWEEAQDE